jgi:hypothetical protein
MRLDLGPSLAEILAAEEKRIDASALAASEAVRPTTLARMDAARLAEAQRFLDPAAERQPTYPTLELMAGAATLDERASLVLRLHANTQHRLAAIEAARLGAKQRLRACICPAAMRQIRLEIPRV